MEKLLATNYDDNSQETSDDNVLMKLKILLETKDKEGVVNTLDLNSSTVADGILDNFIGVFTPQELNEIKRRVKIKEDSEKNTLVLSEILNIKLDFSRKAMENVARYFSSAGKDVPKTCDNQADIFQNAHILENLKGSSVGQILKLQNRKILILLPSKKEERERLMRRRSRNFEGILSLTKLKAK